MKCSEKQLIDFLERHQATLQLLGLRDVLLSEGNWDSCFEALAGKMPVLKSVELNGDFTSMDNDELLEFGDPYGDADFTKSMQRYLINGGNMPHADDSDADDSDDVSMDWVLGNHDYSQDPF